MAGKFLLCWRVGFVEPRQHVLDGFYVVFPIMLVQRLTSCIQSDCRVDTANSRSNTSSVNGVSFPDAAPAHCGDLGNSVEVAAVQVRMHSKIFVVGRPFTPYLVPSFRSHLHLAIGGPCVSSLRITFEHMLTVRRKPVQQFCKSSKKKS